MDSPKKEHLVRASESLFRQYGIRRVTVEEICMTAGVSKMTFYKYFRNKMAIAQEMLSRMWDDGEKVFEKIMAEKISFTEKAERLIQYKITQGRKFSPEFLEEIMGGYPELRAHLMQRNQAYMGRLIQFFTDAQEAGDVRSAIPASMFPVYLNSLNQLVENEVVRSQFPDRTSMIEEMIRMFFYGICSSNPGNAQK